MIKQVQINNQLGKMLVMAVASLGVVLFSVLFIIAGAQLYSQNSIYSANAERATALAEAGVDKALGSINRTGGNYSGEGLDTDGVSIGQGGEGEYSVKITPLDAASKVIEATGYIPNKAKAKVKRTIKITASRGVGTAFLYGIQVGEGGMELGNSNVVTGSVYSNGSIVAGNSNQVSGDIWVAGGPQPTPDQAAPACEG